MQLEERVSCQCRRMSAQCNAVLAPPIRSQASLCQERETCLVHERVVRPLQYIETDMQRLRMKLKVEPWNLHEAIEAEYLAAAKAKPVRRPLDLEPSPKPGPCRMARICIVKNGTLCVLGCLPHHRRTRKWLSLLVPNLRACVPRAAPCRYETT